MRHTLALCAGLALLVTVACNQTVPTGPSPTAASAVPRPASLAAKGGQAKVSVCHRGSDDGVWKLMSVGAPALDAHLANHDDAPPGGTTTLSATSLDAACRPAPDATCPCWDAAYLIDLFAPGEPFRPLMGTRDGGSSSRGAFINDARSGGYEGPFFIAEAWDDEGTACYVRNQTTGATLIDLDVTQAEFDSCRADVADAFAVLGVPTP